jgi:hypothetical protein
MSGAETIERDQLMRRYEELREGIRTATTPADCELGRHMQQLGVLLCESQVFALRHSSDRQPCPSGTGIIGNLAVRSPVAGAIVFAAYVYGKAQGLF